jgi:hypothetical protein
LVASLVALSALVASLVASLVALIASLVAASLVAASLVAASLVASLGMMDIPFVEALLPSWVLPWAVASSEVVEVIALVAAPQHA